MSFTYSIQSEGGLVVAVFRGEITPAEEAEAFLAVTNDPKLRRDARYLVDKRGAQMTVGPEDVEPQVDLIENQQPKMGTPKMAVVVGSDHDFGMMRVLEARAEGRVSHDFAVFRDLGEAFEWLGVAPADVVWPAIPD